MRGYFLIVIIILGQSLFETVSSFSTPRPRNASRIPTLEVDHVRWENKADVSSTSLPALSSVVSAVAHTVGGVTGTPIVVTATKPSGWYRKIDLPPWTPPDRIFGPVWTTLYTSMGVAFARVLRASSWSSLPVRLWLVHYALNLAWAPVFFGMKRLRAGLWINGALALTLGGVIPLYAGIDKIASLLLMPYALWLLFAIALNFFICKGNPTVRGYNNAMFQAGLIRLQTDAEKYANS